MVLDTHCHLLPGVDDGAADLEQSLTLLTQEQQQGVDAVLCTPHFYPQHDNAQLRDEAVAAALRTLCDAAQAKGLPPVLLGHEVHYFPGIGHSTDILRYCYANTNVLLLELPFATPLTRSMLQEVEQLSDQIGYEVVLAHIERYHADLQFRRLIDMVKKGVVKAQIAPGSTTDKKERKCTCKLLKQNLVSYVGSDAHHPVRRPVTLGKELAAIAAAYPQAARRIAAESRDLYERMLGLSHADQSDTLYTPGR